jgi:hypothetical protein
VTDDDISNAEKALAGIHFPRQSTPKEYKFDVYFNTVAANMTTEGGWIPYVLLQFLFVCPIFG